jgi:hypothetical protein
VAGGVVLRAWVAVGSYDLTIDPAPATLGLAQAFSWGLTIRAHRQITVGTARVTLRCREFALSGSGNSRSTHERTVYEEVREVPGRLLLPTEVLELRTTFTVPPTAVPSFERGDNSVRWDLRLSAPVPGWCPDLGEIRPLQVSAQAVSGESLSGDSAIPAAWAEAVSPCDSLAASGGVRATLATPEGVTVKGAAAVPVGETRNLALTVESDRGVECRGVWAWVGCRLHGSGNEAKVALAEEQAIHQGPLPAGRPLRHMLAVSVPPEGPVTFTGEHVKCDWLVRLRFDIPVWPDQHLDVPFLVTPRLTAPSRDTT